MSAEVALHVDLAAVPWPSLVVGRDGAVIASDAAIQMLGFAPRGVQELEQRIVVLSSAGEPVLDGEQPWRRAARSRPFEDDERWRDRVTGEELVLRVRGREVEAARRSWRWSVPSSLSTASTSSLLL